MGRRAPGGRAAADGRGHAPTRRPETTGSNDGISPLQALAAWAVLIVGLGGGIVAFGGTAGPAAALEPGATVTQATTELYTANCASCHGLHGEGSANGPTLVGVGAASADFYVRTGRMPLGAPGQRPVRQDPIFSEEQIQALVGYVAGLGAGPSIPTVQGGGDVGRGFELYTANCAACHGATGGGNVVGGGSAAVGLGQATPTQIGEALVIGPGVMPPFAFSDEDRAAVTRYVEYLQTAPSPGGAPIGGVGPVAEGFVAVLIGLVGLVLIARFVGSRRHGGAGDEGDEIGAASGPATEPGP